MKKKIKIMEKLRTGTPGRQPDDYEFNIRLEVY